MASRLTLTVALLGAWLVFFRRGGGHYAATPVRMLHGAATVRWSGRRRSSCSVLPLERGLADVDVAVAQVGLVDSAR